MTINIGSKPKWISEDNLVKRVKFPEEEKGLIYIDTIEIDENYFSDIQYCYEIFFNPENKKFYRQLVCYNNGVIRKEDKLEEVRLVTKIVKTVQWEAVE